MLFDLYCFVMPHIILKLLNWYYITTHNRAVRNVIFWFWIVHGSMSVLYALALVETICLIGTLYRTINGYSLESGYTVRIVVQLKEGSLEEVQGYLLTIDYKFNDKVYNIIFYFTSWCTFIATVVSVFICRYT